MSQHRIITQLLAQVDGLKQKNFALKKLHRKVNWRKIETTNPPIERSSHCISVVGSVVFMLGGENVARTPIDSQLHTIDISATTPTWAVMEVNGTPPSERIAHAQVVTMETSLFEAHSVKHVVCARRAYALGFRGTTRNPHV